MDVKAMRMSRLLTHYKGSKPFCILSAFTSGRSLEENMFRTQTLLNLIRSMGFGYTLLDGYYIYPDTKQGSKEGSILVPEMDRETGLRLGQSYDQWSILVKDENGFEIVRCSTGEVDERFSKIRIFEKDPESGGFSAFVKGSHSGKRWSGASRKVEALGKSDAYWISPDGTIIDAGSHHINAVIKDPEKYGTTKEMISIIYKEEQEPMGLEGKARDRIMTDIMRDGWIRVRYLPRNDMWIFQLWNFRDNHTQDNVWDFLVQAVESKITSKWADIAILNFVDNSRIASNVDDVTSRRIFSMITLHPDIFDKFLSIRAMFV